MNHKKMTPHEIQIEGTKALLERLGVSGTIQFFQHFNLGDGDYTKERKQWVQSLGIDEIANKIEKNHE